MTRLNTQYVETQNTGKLKVGDVVEILNTEEFHDGAKVGDRAVVLQIRTIPIIALRFAVLGYEVEGFDHLVFRNIDFEDFEDEVKFLGRQTDAHEFQTKYLEKLGASNIRVLDLARFDEDYVEVNTVYPLVGAALKPKIKWVESEDEGLVGAVTGWEADTDEDGDVLVFQLQDGHIQYTPLDEGVELALAS